MGRTYHYYYRTTRKGAKKDNVIRELIYLADNEDKMKAAEKELSKKSERIKDNELELLCIDLYSVGLKLDVGCGERKIGDIGVDKKRKPGVSIVCDARALPFRNLSFDTVISHHVLEHIREYDVAIREMYRIAKSVIIVVVPRKEHSYVHEGHILHFSKEEWISILSQGLVLEEVFTMGISDVFICNKWQKVISSPKPQLAQKEN